MVAGVSVELNSSEDEGVVVKRRSLRQKIMVESDDEAATDADILKMCNSISSTELDKEPSRDDLRSDSRDLMEEAVHGEVDTKKKKKKWKILLDSDCSLDEETPSGLLSVAKNAEGSDDESPGDSMGHGPLLHFSLLKEGDLYDADGSEDEAAPKQKSTGKSKPKGRSLSERKTKSKAVQQIHSETQRLVRESRVSLPYHKPRQRSLTEFLQRRNASTPSAMSLKVSTKDLGQVWKKLEERERDAKEFYKSDSDDSDDTVYLNGPSINGSCDADMCCSVPPTVHNNTPVSDASIPNRDMNICDSEICVADISGTTEVGIRASNHEMTIPDSHTKVGIPGRSASICTEESDADVRVPCSETKSLSSILIANDNYKLESEQSLMAEDSFDLCLHYSESQDVTQSAPHDESNAMEAGNTEELTLHYSETQDSEPSEELQKQKTTAWQENMPLPSPHSEGVDDTAKAILQSLARRSLPGMGDITKLQPRLSAAPNGVIELDEEEPGPAGVVKLVQRFMKHSAVKRPLQKKHTVEVGVISAEKDMDGLAEVHKEVVKVVLGTEEPEDDPAMAKPGEKLQQLKEQLQQQIAQRRAEEWGRRLREQQLDNEEEEHLSKCEDVQDELQVQLTDAETESEEEEEEDIVLKEKKRVKNAFLDDEAEVSDDDDDDDNDDGDEDDEEDVAHGKPQRTDPREKSTSRERETDVPGDGSEGDETSSAAGMEMELTASPMKTKLERAKTFDMFVSQGDDRDSDLEMILPYQPPGVVRRQVTPIMDRRRHILDLISPVSNLTSLKDSPSTQSEVLSSMPACVPKKLFDELQPTSTQDIVEELMGLCSGQFTGDMDPKLERSQTGLEDELLGLCSGKFVSQPVNLRSLEQDEAQSQPIESPLKCGLKLPSTDDEEEELVQTKAHKKHNKLYFSDESDVESDTTSEAPDVSKANFVEYDSEENEVDTSKLQGQAVAEFFEDEAELSESEWESADEDEQGLDTLESEEGDAEKLDQRKVKEQLDKIYMRRLLDEDRREVRFLQEMLLEDGELHSEGGGRERKFHWRNINNTDDRDLPRQDSDNEGLEEVEMEDEELWRRMRYEREIFLQQQKMKSSSQADDILDDDSDSQLLKLGWAALKKANSQDPAEQTPSIRRTMSDPVVSPDPKRAFQLVTQRGSFLARSRNALARIAELTRSSTGGPVVGPKNSRNFVFATLSPEKVEECSADAVPLQMKKRKEDLGVTPPIVKRLRISDENVRGRRLLDLLT
ncbi:claspin isoform X3 [Cryptotermes secundus]|nr:claspin isoform X3 [Cryptotermes secundus]XP_033606806.1 claspin isoform X3 [Cryptotermes secundus]XP_033606807.1 claspin isoform X3 [Cryptotermes secundus]XP_033606808.1 claspin isoform X3 [Cryptotermes secundus]